MARDDGIDVSEVNHLAYPNWGDPKDRRCIAASLVNVAYLLQNHKGRATEWCCLLQFDVIEIMKDDHDSSICGAVFQWRGKQKAGAGGPPSEVVAFRGTLLSRHTALKDLYLDLKVALGRLNSSSSRVVKGRECLRKSINRQGPHNVWLAGHSLGSAIAALAAKDVIKEGHKLEAHLFNPPFATGILPDFKFVQNIAKALSAVHNRCLPLPSLEPIMRVVKEETTLAELRKDFAALRHWVPTLYVNDKDPICLNYIYYFEAWKNVYVQHNHANVSHLVQVHECIKHVCCLDLFPSAKVAVAIRGLFHNHHCIRQWFSKELQIETREYIPSIEITQCNGMLSCPKDVDEEEGR